jgi:hypothetical protein
MIMRSPVHTAVCPERASGGPCTEIRHVFGVQPVSADTVGRL